jgi:hypothetical protein
MQAGAPPLPEELATGVAHPGRGFVIRRDVGNSNL